MRNILLTGGTGIIGTILTGSLVSDGHRVIITSRSREKGDSFIKESGLPKDKVLIVEVDFESDDALKIIKTQLPEKIDAVIHNARTVETLKINDQARVSIEQFQVELFMAVTFPYELTSALIEWNTGLKDVLFISSIYGIVGPTPSLYDDFHHQSPINYGVAKASQIHLTKELAVRLADKDIRVNCISYGGVEGRADETFKKRYRARTPFKGMLKANDIYPPVQYILNNPDISVTGENLKVDGGWTIW